MAEPQNPGCFDSREAAGHSGGVSRAPRFPSLFMSDEPPASSAANPPLSAAPRIPAVRGGAGRRRLPGVDWWGRRRKEATAAQAGGDDLLPIAGVVDETVKHGVRQGLSRKNTTTAARSCAIWTVHYWSWRLQPCRWPAIGPLPWTTTCQMKFIVLSCSFFHQNKLFTYAIVAMLICK